MTDTTDKPCSACGMPIKKEAKRCHNCLSWQFKWTKHFSMIMVLAVMILFSLMIYDVYDSVARGSTSFANYQESLVIVDSNIHYGEKDTCSYITCIGHIKNNSSIPWEKIRFEIQYFNKDGELIDTVADKNYSVIVPPDTEVAFRVYDKAAREKEQYVKHNVIVRWADDAR